jgi:hypothetical protein
MKMKLNPKKHDFCAGDRDLGKSVPSTSPPLQYLFWISPSLAFLAKLGCHPYIHTFEPHLSMVVWQPLLTFWIFQ